jgi:hypothetical protein
MANCEKKKQCSCYFPKLEISAFFQINVVFMRM